MTKMVLSALCCSCLVFSLSQEVRAQEAAPTASQTPKMSIDFLAGYGLDDAQSSALGFETQGRVGYVIFAIDGKIKKNFSYKIEVNPVNESSPLPACGEKNYFFPNDPTLNKMGPNVSCDPNGRHRVDDYRFVALDPIHQQGPVRQAFITYTRGSFSIRGGRFILPIGFQWNENGSFTAKDATHIQRINAESEFGFGIGYSRSRIRTEAIVFAGDTRYRDYDYFYFIDWSLDSNSGLNSMAFISIEPAKGLEIKGTFKKGFSGSKVERLPNFWASKRHDDAVVISGKYSPIYYVTVFGEYAKYTWGLTKTSAELINRPDTSAVKKPGYYVGVTGKYPLTSDITAGITATREELSRNDSLVKYLAEENMFNARLGQKERVFTMRYFVTMYKQVTIGAYTSKVSNPFPWLSGIAPVSGQTAYQNGGSDKWGVTIQFTHKFN